MAAEFDQATCLLGVGPPHNIIHQAELNTCILARHPYKRISAHDVHGKCRYVSPPVNGLPLVWFPPSTAHNKWVSHVCMYVCTHSQESACIVDLHAVLNQRICANLSLTCIYIYT